MRSKNLQVSIVASLLIGLIAGCGRTITVTDLSSLMSAPTASVDAVPPKITTFTLPASSAALTVNGIRLQATDDSGVTGFYLSEEAATPLPSSSGWLVLAPTSHVFSTDGLKTLYAWAKDSAGNMSDFASATVMITLADSTKPTVNAFTVPGTVSSPTIPVNTFTASDDVGVTGYMITESPTAPLSSATGWSSIRPMTYTVQSAGAKTLYAWAKDAAGNVSDSVSAAVLVTAQYTVTSSGTNASLSPSGPQIANLGATLSFTVSPDPGYMISSNVGGTCPSGHWSGTVYSTGAINSDCSVSFSASVSIQITTITVQNPLPSPQTNVPVTIGLPLAPNALPFGSKVQVVDSDGITPLPVQEDSRASDLYGNLRFTNLTILLPALNASENRTLTLYAQAGAPAIGTDIGAADILATSYDYQATIADHDGNTYRCSARSGLAAGNYLNTTTAAQLGMWRSGGGLATEYIVSVPPTTDGGAVHPQLRCIFDVLAFKSQRGAVSAGNPILAIRTDRVMESGWVQKAVAVTDDWYGLTETSGTTSFNYPNTTPSQSLVIASNTVRNTTATASSDLFTINSMGSLITDGTGFGVITGYNSATQVLINLYKPFASAALSGGSYTIYGIAHTYGSRYRQRIWWSGLGTPAYSANLGSAWNNATLSGGPLSYLTSTQTILNYATPASSITNTITRVQGQGSNPVAYYSNQTNGSYGGGNAGDIQMYVGMTGERGDIGILPDWYTGALIRYDSNASALIFGDADKANLMPLNMRDPSTGKQLRMDNGVDWYLSNNLAHPFGANYINLPNFNPATTAVSNWYLEDAHLGQFYYVPYLLTGDWYWIDSMEFLAQYLWLDNNAGYSGSQLNRLKLFSGQQRGVAWAMRSIGEMALVTPDSSPPVLGWSKAHVQTWLANHWTATNSGQPDVPPYPGAQISLLNNTGPGKKFATVGPRYTIANPGYSIPPWQVGYTTIALLHLKELGMLDSTGLDVLAWFGEGITSAVNDTAEVVPEYAVPLYWTGSLPKGVSPHTWSDFYIATAFNVGPNADGNNRKLTSAMTLSDNSGTAMTATLPTGNFNGGNWYVGGWLCVPSHTTDNVCAPPSSGPGTITFASGSGAVTGTGTSFTHLSPGMTIVSNGEAHVISSITSDTSMLTDNWSSSKRGLSYVIGAAAAQITAVAVNTPPGYDTLTLNTSGTYLGGNGAYGGGPFASTTLAGGTYLVPWPAPGDPIGTEKQAYFSNPGNDYYDIALCANMLLNQDGYPGEPAAYNTLSSWPGHWNVWEIKWHLNPRN